MKTRNYLDLVSLKKRCDAFFGTPDLWPVLAAAYSGPHRYYHTLHHLQELFDALQPYVAGTGHARAIELAVWFHDFVYEVEHEAYAMNETSSAEALLRILGTIAPHWGVGQLSSEVALAQTFIVATKKHLLPTEGSWGPDVSNACQLFLDADLSILASAPERLLEYDDGIAQEWGQDPERPTLEFCVGRADALERFAQRPVLYYTGSFKGLELRARDNLKRLEARWRTLGLSAR